MDDRWEGQVERVVNALDRFLDTLEIPESFKVRLVNYTAENLGDALEREYSPAGEYADYCYELAVERELERELGHE